MIPEKLTQILSHEGVAAIAPLFKIIMSHTSSGAAVLSFLTR